MRIMHTLPAPISSSPFPPVFSIWCGENGWNEVIAEIADTPTQVPRSASAIGTGLWGLQFAASGALPPLKHFIAWVRGRGIIPVIEVPRNAQGQAEKLHRTGAKVVVSPWNLPVPKTAFTTFFHDAPDPTDIPHSDDFSLPVPLANLVPPADPEIIKELSYLSPEAKSVISVVALLVEKARENNVIVFPRGSAGGSSWVCAIFGIPKHPRALFQRFYFPGKASLPDIDIDTDQQGRVMQLLSLVCEENGYKPYRLLTSDMRLSCGLLVLPVKCKVPSVGTDDQGIDVSPFLTKMAEKGCKVDILQSYSLGLLKMFGHTVQDMCAISLTPAPVPDTTAVVPHFRTRWGTTMFDCFRQVSKTITVDDVALLLALMRPGASKYAGYVLSAKYGRHKAFDRLQHFRPRGRIFVYQEDLMRFVAHRFGWAKADEIRKQITKGTPEQKERAREFLKGIGVDPQAAAYTFCFSHAYLYALVCMYFIHQLAHHPREVFEFFCSHPVSSTLSVSEKERIYQAARKYGYGFRLNRGGNESNRW